MKKIKIIIAVCAVVFIVSAVVCAVLLCAPHGDIVEIRSDGELLYTIDLAASSDRTFIVEHDGKKNTIIIENHRICVSDADCPDKVCVRTGWLDSPSIPIVCLPNKLVIEYAGSDVDAAAR